MTGGRTKAVSCSRWRIFGLWCGAVLLAGGAAAGEATQDRHIHPLGTTYSHGDPTAEEQYLLEVINRARRDPVAEGARLGIDITEGLTEAEKALVRARPPLAFSASLLQVAREHSQDMHDRNFFSHTNPDGLDAEARITANYGQHTATAENIACGTDNTAAQLADALMVDAGVSGRGHRKNLLHVYDFAPLRQVGLGVYAASANASGYTDFLTQDFATPYPDQAFLTGVVYDDKNGNGFYDPGEGLPSVVVMPNYGFTYTFTSTSGGYAIPITAAGTDGNWQVTFSGGGLVASFAKTVAVTVGGDNVYLSATAAEAVRPGIESFVTRLYQQCLGRQPDAAGLKGWSDGLQAGSVSGGEVARNFFLSDEFVASGTSNTDFIETLYSALFDRQADDAGFAAWSAELTAGRPREDLVLEFAFSQEFANLCANYGITATNTGLSQQRQVRAFVRRFYLQCLNREPDDAGVSDWTAQLIAGTRSGADVARGFAGSAEFGGRNLSDGDYVDTLYRAFFGREPDAAGRAGWLAELAAGQSRASVQEGFVQAAEFAALCGQYGIN